MTDNFLILKRYKDSAGYIRIYLPEHEKSTSNGWVFEHIVLAEQKLGRSLKKNEEVHHINAIRDDNNLENLEVLSKFKHRSLHGKRNDLRKEFEENIEVYCACGCEKKLWKYDIQGRPRKYILGHHTRKEKIIMKHKIKLVEYNYRDDYGVYVEIDGERLLNDATYTFSCLEEVLKQLGIDFELEYFSENEETKIITKKMKLVEDK